MATRTDRPNAGEYRNQLIAMLDDATAARIEADAAEPGATKASVIRRYLELGIKRHDALERAKTKPERDASAMRGAADYSREAASKLSGPAD